MSKLAPQHLHEDHRERLRTHYGLSEESIIVGRFWSAGSSEAGKHLGWKAGGPGPGIFIPYPRCDGHFRFRRDRPEGSRKYESPKGQDLHLYILPRLREQLADASVPLILVEGEFKAIRAVQDGFCCVGLPGVSGWSKPRTEAEKATRKPRQLRPDFDQIALDGRAFYIVFDSDVLDKRSVHWEEWFLSRALLERGTDVQCVRLPDGPDGEKTGLDDFLNRVGDNGPNDFRRLMAEAKPPERPDFSIHNYRLVTVEDHNGKEKREPVALDRIIRMTDRLTGEWPRECGGSLFVVSDDRRVDWLQQHAQLFGFLHHAAKPDGVKWMAGPGFVTKGEYHAEVVRRTQRYESVELFPHFPSMPNTFYVPRNTVPIAAARGSLDKLVDRFCPETAEDRELIRLAFITPAWGGPAGQRPGFAIDSNAGDCGRGVGKTRLAMMVGHLYGGYFLIGQSEDREKLLKRILTPSARTKRIAIIDNAKGTLSSADIESLITSHTLSGYANYVGEAERPNTLCWFITANGVELSKDLAQRMVMIHLAMPAYEADWERATIELIDRRREETFTDIARILTDERPTLERFSRWGAWEASVLATARKPDDLQTVIEERQNVADTDKDLFDAVVDYFAHQLREAGYAVDDNTLVRIPSGVASQWYLDATGERVKPMTAARRLKAACGGHYQIQPDPSRVYGRCFLFAGSPEAASGVPVHFDPDLGRTQ